LKAGFICEPNKPSDPLVGVGLKFGVPQIVGSEGGSFAINYFALALFFIGAQTFCKSPSEALKARA
jgi:hypothetical protein